ncbi:MAG TPA: hypothetical protein VIJ93_09225, partial [bacterium]
MKLKSLNTSLLLFLLHFWFSSEASAKPGQLSLSLDILGALPSLNMPSGANQGLGLEALVDYRASDFFAFGLSVGMVEFIAPTGMEDMKTVWLDLMGRFFLLPRSSFGEPYIQGGFGVSPNLKGLFTDYWPDYIGQNYGPGSYQTSPGTIYWTTQVAVGYLFIL